MKKWFHIFHKWDKWSRIGNLHRRGNRNAVVAQVYQRICPDCGKVQSKTIYLY